MAVIALNNFAGETPALSPSTLPENGAQLALNCDFTNQSLTPMKDGLYLNTFAATNPVKSLYTEDGIKFFTWTTDTYPFKGPIINDLYNRVYYLNGSTATVVDGSTASVSGGNPSTLYSWSPYSARSYRRANPRYHEQGYLDGLPIRYFHIQSMV